MIRSGRTTTLHDRLWARQTRRARHALVGGHPEKAVADLLVLRRRPIGVRRERTQILLARALRAAGALDWAERELTRCVGETEPFATEIAVERAELATARREWHHARHLWGQLHAATALPKSDLVPVRFAGSLLRTSEGQRAREVLEAALERWPDRVRLQLAHFDAVAQVDGFNAAFDALNGWQATAAPDDPTVLSRLLWAARRSDRPADARLLLQAAPTASLEHPRVLRQAARLAAEERDFPAAAKLWTSFFDAVEIEQNLADALDFVACLRHLDRQHEALDLLDLILEQTGDRGPVARRVVTLRHQLRFDRMWRPPQAPTDPRLDASWGSILDQWSNLLGSTSGSLGRVRARALHAALYRSEELRTDGADDPAGSVVTATLASVVSGADPRVRKAVGAFAEVLPTLRSGQQGVVARGDVASLAKTMEPGFLPYGISLLLYEALAWNGALRAAATIRDGAMRHAETRGRSTEATASDQRLYARVLLEQGDAARVHGVGARLVDRLGTEHRWVGELSEWLRRLGLQDEATWDRHVTFPTQDPPYSELFRDRSVAIVGPAPPVADQGEEIDGFDVVIRFNYAGELRAEARAVGTRTDVSWYNNLDSRTLTDGSAGPPDALADLQASFVKATKHDYQRALRDAGRLFVMEQVPFLVRKRPNQLPNALWTVLLARPERIKVFNSNFFLSASPYGSGYRDSEFDFTGFLHSLNFEDHDLVSQLRFVQLLRSLALVEADDEAAAVLGLSPHDYLAGLERVHVDGSNH